MYEVSIFVSVLLALLALVCGLFLGFIAGLRYRQSSVSADNSQSHVALTTQLSSQLRPLHDSLTSLSGKVQQFEVNQRENLAGLRSQLKASQLVDQQILETTLGLDSALRNTSKRGSWGEASLRRVLELSGLTKQIDFLEQVPLENELGKVEGIPDAIVHLPNRAALIIDSKVPLDAYLEAEDFTDPQQLRLHAQAVRRHVATLTKRDYQRQLSTAIDSVILFMPSEALVSASFQGDPTVFDQALQQGVIIVGPSGLMTLLRSVGHLWSRQSLNEDAAEILRLGTILTQRLGRLSTLLTSLGKHLQSAVGAYNDVVASFESRFKTPLRAISALEAKVSAETKPVDLALRLPHSEVSADS
ncbi:DNA recombination protein RmuC [Gleimia sp. 6138-11-ORH1]|uniref:DNA recombination protein RmuC n=1 Tax=Gleimia sp. 6138-11-ORH1 TaxID=2973937 RepID=UPI0021691A84|nr:DNA recombination protein RmuC [Gleimia sp. 6138-11-ORH1]MCS4485227.1 DNA recombination protein RmuC [Gleimia sp. 6138-11-ORH1]